MKLWRSSRSISFQLLAGLVASGAGVAAWMGFWMAALILPPVFLKVLLQVSFGVAFKYFLFIIVNITSEWVKFSIKLEKSNFKFVVE
jgi:Na+/H+ antiporter NhaD/arsenite permease-like protein